jgi:hypothetical protein
VIAECGKDVFPDHPEWGEIKCNLQWTHAGACARFDSLPISEESAVAMEVNREVTS